MGETENLDRTEAAKKIKALAEKADTCLFTTNLTSLPLTTRPMSTRAVDEDGCLWFFSRNNSNKNQEITKDNRVQLFYANRSSSEFLSLYGRASILRDPAKAKELWSAFAKTWFNEGHDDPGLTLLKIEPDEAYYWDTKDGKMIKLLKIVGGAILGKEFDGGVEGKLKS